ncbi:MAG TPA: hypothetical protein VFX58_16475 [Chitinophagaceae bacterium]|nr:hypothetical protein [Chitinophagaceae bacterium]
MGAYSKQQADIFSFTINKASLARLKSPSAAVYTERRFMMAELNSFSAAAGIPTKHGNAALEIVYDGFAYYHKSRAGLAYARALGNKIDLGIQFNYYGVKIPGYGSATAVGVDLGILIHHSDKLHTGFSVENPMGGRLGKETGEKIPALYTMGIGYEASAKVLGTVEIIKQEEQPLTVIGAMKYQILPFVWARVGVNSYTSSGWLASGLSWRTLKVEIMTAYHPYLGVTPGLLIVFTGKNKKE